MQLPTRTKPQGVSFIACECQTRGHSQPTECRPGPTIFFGFITLPLVKYYGLCGSAKKKMSLTYFPLVQNQQHLPCSNEKIMYQHVLTAAWKAILLLKQGSYRSWKTWKVLNLSISFSRPGKSWNLIVGRGKLKFCLIDRLLNLLNC